MRTSYLVLILTILGLGGIFFWYTNSGPSVSENGAPSQESIVEEPKISSEPVVVISYTNDGYTPSVVGIKKGKTVRFTNNSQDQETWPASAVHPTHSIYPEKKESDCLGSSFDACRGLKPGESWDFTFNTAGEWRFHDHLHAAKTGVVNVAE